MMDRSTWATMVGASTTWFDQWLAFLQPQVVKVSDLVAANPDDPPLPSPADLIAAVSPPYLGIPSILNYMLAKLQYYEFTQVAVCNMTSGPCTVKSGTIAFTGADVTLCGSNSYYVNRLQSQYQFPAGQHRVVIDIQINAPHSLQVDTFTVNSSNAIAEPELCVPWAAGAPFHLVRNCATSSDRLAICIWDSGANPTWVVGAPVTLGYSNLTIETPCSPLSTPPPAASSPEQPVTIVVPPTLSCGTTADLCTAVRQLDQRLTQIYNLVTLIQRHRAPFAYVPGAVHSGLSGSGSFPISGLLGLRVQLVSTAAGPVLPGNPPYLWDQGWLSVNDSQGMLVEKRLTRTGYEWFPDMCEVATSFNWTVAPGVVMNVTELEAET